MSVANRPLGWRPMIVGLTAVVAVLALGAPPAVAQTVLFQDDAEGAIDAKWTVVKAKDARIQPWQKSDSSTPKFRGNQAKSGRTSYWTGSSPPFEPNEVIEGDSILQAKEALVIPADGTTTLSLWSIFQNEGDDQGLVEVATDDGSGALRWRKLTQVQLQPSAVGDPYTPGYCNPAHPAETASEGFSELKGNFDAYRGARLFLRLNMKYGAENRTTTQPCGWYVDDIVISTTGTPGTGGGGGGTAAPPPATTAPAGPAGPPAAKPGLRVTKLRGKGRKATISLTVTGGPIRNASVVLLDRRGKKKLARGRAASLAAGKRSVKLKGKGLKRGRYRVQVTGTGPDGKPFSFKASARLR